MNFSVAAVDTGVVFNQVHSQYSDSILPRQEIEGAFSEALQEPPQRGLLMKLSLKSIFRLRMLPLFLLQMI